MSCLAFIGWTTPLMELIPVFQRLGIPAVLIDLALMIYRFLFVTATTLGEMHRAQSWRLGRADYRSRMRALSMLASGLFLRCVQRARRLEDGIEARGYQGRLWVLAPRHAASPAISRRHSGAPGWPADRRPSVQGGLYDIRFSKLTT